jgi:hypothetical protein
MNIDLAFLQTMIHSPLKNYAIPGLTSSLVGGVGGAKIRLFECSRDHQEAITPHSHRFDFTALVIRGQVINRIWHASGDGYGDSFLESTLQYGAEPGKYEVFDGVVGYFQSFDDQFSAGQTYSMRHDQIHSIYFSKDSAVLMFEGPTILDSSIILQPHVDGVVIPTFKVEDWMFQKE